MKELPLSNCERAFILKAIKEQIRLDGRTNDEFRDIKINFGADWGSALVAIGETKVLAQVSCELGIPKAVRPNEGLLFINVELGPMAAPHLELTRNSELHVQINRTLERTFKDSRAVDLESLCVRAEEHVWILRVDLNVLNHEGNLIDCCSIATLCALAHFRRPDVSIDEDRVHIHTAAEKEPLPTVLHHYPVCVSYCTFNEGSIAVADPSASEERSGESQMVFGFNAYRELCCLNLGGSSLTSSRLLLQCANRAAQRAKQIVEQVKQALKTDKELRDAGEKVCFSQCMVLDKISSLAEDHFSLRLRNFKLNEAVAPKQTRMEVEEKQQIPTKADVVSLDAQSAILKSKKSNIKWVPDEDDDDYEDENIVNFASESSAEEAEHDENAEEKAFNSVLETLKGQWPEQQKTQKSHADDSDSEEDEKMVL